MRLHDLLSLLDEPLNRRRKLLTIRRIAKSFLARRFSHVPIPVDFVNHSQLMLGQDISAYSSARTNYFTGLDDFEDMAFLLHALRPADLFIDVGANAGAYTVLAGAAIGARCQSFEPVPSTFKHLLANIQLNGLADQVDAQNIGLGHSTGTLLITSDTGQQDHVVGENEPIPANVIEVSITSLDEASAGTSPMLIKIDVEGFETNVILGADRLLRSTSPLALIMELIGHGRKYGFDDEQLHRKMLGYGFEAFAYKPFTREIIALTGKNNECMNTIYLKEPSAFIERVKSAPKFTVNGQAI